MSRSTKICGSLEKILVWYLLIALFPFISTQSPSDGFNEKMKQAKAKLLQTIQKGTSNIFTKKFPNKKKHLPGISNIATLIRASSHVHYVWLFHLEQFLSHITTIVPVEKFHKFAHINWCHRAHFIAHHFFEIGKSMKLQTLCYRP